MSAIGKEIEQIRDGRQANTEVERQYFDALGFGGCFGIPVSEIRERIEKLEANH